MPQKQGSKVSWQDLRGITRKQGVRSSACVGQGMRLRHYTASDVAEPEGGGKKASECNRPAF
jgi:hypothetical protein